MRSTPIEWGFNAELLALIPRNATRVIEVGCSSGALGREYRKNNPHCAYVGVELDAEFANIASAHCTETFVGDIEQMTDAEFAQLFPSDCWVFGDVLEHLYDPWLVLKKVRTLLPTTGSVVACIPNAQHWSVQARLNTGELWYEEKGLLDWTHIRFFTKTTITHLFKSTGYEIVEGGARIFDAPEAEQGLQYVRAMAAAIGRDVEEAVKNAAPLQWIVRAVPA